MRNQLLALTFTTIAAPMFACGGASESAPTPRGDDSDASSPAQAEREAAQGGACRADERGYTSFLNCDGVPSRLWCNCENGTWECPQPGPCPRGTCTEDPAVLDGGACRSSCDVFRECGDGTREATYCNCMNGVYGCLTSNACAVDAGADASADAGDGGDGGL